MITLNDTNLKGKIKPKVPNYFSYEKNREKFKGGVATIVANHLKPNTMKVTEGEDSDEYLITRFGHTAPPINIVNIYGQQESRTVDSEIEKAWLRLMKHINEIEMRNEAVIIIGDMNRAIGTGQYGIKGNKSTVSFGGNLIRNILKDGKYVLLNNLDIVKGGPWTWTDRRDKNRKSCLDLAIMSSCLLPYLDRVEIDKDRNYTPRRVIKRKHKIVTIFSDHFSLKMELKGIPKKLETHKIEVGWNLGKPGGWDNYKTTTDEVSEKIMRIVEQDEEDINVVMKKINAIDTKVRFKSFGKTKPCVKAPANEKSARRCASYIHVTNVRVKNKKTRIHIEE